MWRIHIMYTFNVECKNIMASQNLAPDSNYVFTCSCPMTIKIIINNRNWNSSVVCIYPSCGIPNLLLVFTLLDPRSCHIFIFFLFSIGPGAFCSTEFNTKIGCFAVVIGPIDYPVYGLCNNNKIWFIFFIRRLYCCSYRASRSVGA